MKFDPQIVAQARAFVNAFKRGTRARTGNAVSPVAAVHDHRFRRN